jgi:hypothetical protein
MTIETLNLESIANKTMYVSLSFGRFGNRRKAKVEIVTEANAKRFNHSKKLLESPELSAIAKADAGIKLIIDALCLPTRKEIGIRLAPKANIKKIVAIAKQYQQFDRPELVKAAVLAYPDQRSNAMVELKEHFNPLQFPSVEEFEKAFYFEYKLLNFGVPVDLQEIDPEVYEAEVQKEKQTFVESITEITKAFRFAASELVTKLAEGLKGGETADGKPRKLYSAHFDMLTEFLSKADVMNVHGDTDLKGELDTLKLLMTGVDVEKVRHNDGLKADLAAKVGAIAESLSKMAEVKPGRFFRNTPNDDTSKQELDTANTGLAAVAQ